MRTRFAELDGDRLIETLAAIRLGPAVDTTGQALRRLARRHQALTKEIDRHRRGPAHPDHQVAPTMLATKGLGVISAATLLITAAGTSKKDVLRCLKRAIAREAWHLLVHPAPHHTSTTSGHSDTYEGSPSPKPPTASEPSPRASANSNAALA